MSDTNENLLPRNKSDWKAFAKNIILVVFMAASAYGGTAAANEQRVTDNTRRIESLENSTHRIEDKLDRLIEKQERTEP